MEWCAHLDALQFFEVVDHLTKNQWSGKKRLMGVRFQLIPRLASEPRRLWMRVFGDEFAVCVEGGEAVGFQRSKR
jgi:hypothetical protein